MTPTAPRQKTYDLLIVGLGLLLAGLVMYKNSYFVHDDAFITLRYAVNFAQTGLPQWNVGEWAEGYTSLLHMTLESLLIRAGLPPIAAMYTVNTTALICLIILSTVAARIISPTANIARTLAVATIAVAPPVALWTLGGLEAILVAAFFMAGLTSLLAGLRTPRITFTLIAALAFSCAILTRLDSAVFITGVGLGFVLASPRPLAARLFNATLIVGIPAAVSFVQMGIRHSVYGELFPLTFYAKTDFSIPMRINNGLIYLNKVMPDAPIFAIATLILLAAVFLKRRSPFTTLLIVPVLAHFFYVIWAGGDHMPAARILLPLFAPLTLYIYAFGTSYSPRVAVTLTTFTALIVAFTAIQRPAEKMDNAAFIGGLVGRHIDKNWPHDITIALNTAGTTPYYAQGRNYIDMLGLNDPVIAKRENTPIRKAIQRLPGHAKGDGAYVYARKPDRIIAGPASGSLIESSWFLSGTELNEIPEFHDCYKLHLEWISYPPEVAIRGKHHDNPLPFISYERTCTD